MPKKSQPSLKAPLKTKNMSKTSKASISREILVDYLADLLQVDQVKDYCPNGLQVQGVSSIKKIVTGVTASKALIEEAIAQKADAILVHHGWFWKSDEPVIVGQLHARLKLLMDYNINLLAYHLPLDLHPQLGNNAQLAKIMGWSVSGSKGLDGLIWQGKPHASSKNLGNLGQLARSMSSRLGRDPLVIGDLNQPIKTIAWCTGAAQSYLNEAISMKVDAYISGEISEQTVHIAREMGIAYIAAGHHATERYGIQALGEHLAKKFGLTHTFVDIPNPV
ncbi:MAG: hypothetical protein RLZZ410_1499 [Pseudomonadota bacterium]|jgi:dinuclear metal center YbgI/SA1388 family protein